MPAALACTGCTLGPLACTGCTLAPLAPLACTRAEPRLQRMVALLSGSLSRSQRVRAASSVSIERATCPWALGQAHRSGRHARVSALVLQNCCRKLQAVTAGEAHTASFPSHVVHTHADPGHVPLSYLSITPSPPRQSISRRTRSDLRANSMPSWKALCREPQAALNLTLTLTVPHTAVSRRGP